MPAVRTPADAAGSLPPAGLWRRFMSATYEAVVLFGVLVFFGYAFSALLQYRAGEPGPLAWAFKAWLFVVLGAYFTWFWSDGRRTLPMKTVGLRIVDAAGAAPTRARAALRYLACWGLILATGGVAWAVGHPALLLLLPVPFAWAAFDAQRRALYDVLAGTRLVVDSRPGP